MCVYIYAIKPARVWPIDGVICKDWSKIDAPDFPTYKNVLSL